MWTKLIVQQQKPIEKYVWNKQRKILSNSGGKFKLQSYYWSWNEKYFFDIENFNEFENIFNVLVEQKMIDENKKIVEVKFTNLCFDFFCEWN